MFYQITSRFIALQVQFCIHFPNVPHQSALEAAPQKKPPAYSKEGLEAYKNDTRRRMTPIETDTPFTLLGGTAQSGSCRSRSPERIKNIFTMKHT